MSEKLRSQISDEFKWDTTVIFKTDDDWEKSYDDCMAKVPEISQYKGTLADKNKLLKFFELNEKLNHMCSKIYIYANLRLYEDTTNTFYQGLSERAAVLLTDYSSHSSFFESELLSLDKEYIDQLIENNNDFKKYKHFFHDLYRSKKHVLSPELENLLAKTGEMAGSSEDIFAMINNADIKFGDVVDDEGKEVTLTHGKYSSFLESKNQKVRENAFKTYHKSFVDLKNTLAATYSANVKKDLFYAKARNYDSSLDHALSSDNIPMSVYENLISTVEEYLPVMHDYVAKRKEKLGLDEIHMYDLYTPIVQNVDTKVSYKQAKVTVLESLKPLGKEYTDIVERSYNEKWIDVYENKGKRSGAFSWGAYGYPPFIFLNYDDKVKDMFTLTHEMGHALHSHYTWNNQEYIYGNYTIFVAEVASTVNEALLMEHLLKTSKDKDFNEYLVNYFIEQFRTTVFRQTMFAEFEMITHKMYQDGYPLTVDTLCDIYKSLNKKYYGNDIIIDKEIEIEWARIPHFYSSFYVYKYATGYSAAIALSQKILKGGKKDVDDYLNFLKSGSSDYSIELLKKAGVDMSVPESISNSLSVFKDLVGRI